MRALELRLTPTVLTVTSGWEQLFSLMITKPYSKVTFHGHSQLLPSDFGFGFGYACACT